MNNYASYYVTVKTARNSLAVLWVSLSVSLTTIFGLICAKEWAESQEREGQREKTACANTMQEACLTSRSSQSKHEIFPLQLPSQSEANIANVGKIKPSL